MDETSIAPKFRTAVALIRSRRQDTMRAQYLESSAVCTAHERGVSWAMIGSIYGTSRQAAWQRWGGNFDDPEAN